jgi:hypothetical protein
VTGIVLARVLHVLAVVVWIGGVGMVTTILLNATRRSYPAAERFLVSHALEATLRQASTFHHRARRGQRLLHDLVAGRLGSFLSAQFWWMHAMVLTWLAFTPMLFVLEPRCLERLLARRFNLAPEANYRFLEWLHRCLFGLSLLKGAVAGSLGLNLFGG